MTLTFPIGTLGSVDSLFSISDRNHTLWNIGSTDRYILHMQVLLECRYIYINGKFTMRKLKSSLLSYTVVLNRSSLSISKCMSRNETDITVSVVSFISSSMG
jgi:hypothetical protein